MRKLFRNHSTSNAVPRVPRGIGLIVVGLRVHHDRRTVGQQRKRAVLERDIGILQLSLRLAVGSYCEVLHVAGVMSFGIVETMLLALGVEMPPGRLEVGPFAFRSLVEVDGVFSRREIVQLQLE